MKPANQCGFCGSDRVIPDATIDDAYNATSARPLSGNVGFAKPGSWWDTKPVGVTFRADICCGCGRVTLRVTEPDELWEKYCQIPPEGRR